MSEKLKTVKVRPGMRGFYGRVYEAGEVFQLPVDIKETKDGWFDDVPDETPLSIGAGRVGRKSNDESITIAGNGESAASGDVSGGQNSYQGDLRQDEAGQNATADADSKDENTSEDADNEGAESTEEKVKEPTKADIVTELEELGVQDFNRNSKKAELEELLNSVKSGLVQE